MIILVDLDSITADLMTKWLGAYNRDYNDNLTLDKITKWDTHLFTVPECGIKLYDYLTPELFDSLEPLPGAVDGVNALCSQHDVYFATAAPRGTADAKIAWVKRYFPHLSGKVFTGKDKWMLKADALIDDSGANLNDYRIAHPYSVVCTIDYAYNRDVFVDFRAQSGQDTETAWKQIVGYFNSL